MDQMKALDYSINSGWQQARPGARGNLRRLMQNGTGNAANNLNEHQPSSIHQIYPRRPSPALSSIATTKKSSSINKTQY
jgi:hypothetical protein